GNFEEYLGRVYFDQKKIKRPINYPFSISFGWLLTVLLGNIHGETMAKTNKTRTNNNADIGL
ncbi:MAG TPA: hypothetical protein VGA21_10445, partial [Cyclobacteriaceae bacterium]